MAREGASEEAGWWGWARVGKMGGGSGVAGGEEGSGAPLTLELMYCVCVCGWVYTLHSAAFLYSLRCAWIDFDSNEARARHTVSQRVTRLTYWASVSAWMRSYTTAVAAYSCTPVL